MKLYETTVIFDPGLEEARVNEEVERVTQPIAQAGGEVIEVQRWGKRKLKRYFAAAHPAIDALKRELVPEQEKEQQ